MVVKNRLQTTVRPQVPSKVYKRNREKSWQGKHTEGDAKITESTSSHRHLYSELGVAKSRKKSRESRHDVGDHQSRASTVRRAACGDKDACSHHSAHAKSYDVPPLQFPAHLCTWPCLNLEGRASDLAIWRNEFLRRRNPQDWVQRMHGKASAITHTHELATTISYGIVAWQPSWVPAVDILEWINLRHLEFQLTTTQNSTSGQLLPRYKHYQ